ncbi:SEC-C domain-containing protein [Sinorhizobium meliloti]|uniref:SEC-C domain-containing protein n=1 Tax=Rhizobium meliloti TaxID=382 RepID=UPI000FD48F12|nr:SEC-C domain-containing protein [Sinorhizobium meliloti]RVE91044.1 SEC-C domain-containing protein [Sinorhizobium meliloti]
MKSVGRNDPCWCGSGVKYKKCHLNRSVQETANPWAAVEANRAAFQVKKCYAEDAGLGPCEGKIIKAHTVSRGPNLTKIARSGKVVRYRADPAELTKNGGRLTASEIGIGDASVFYGFCAGHDRELFSCIENEPFIGREDQCLAVAYRTLSREYYGKDAAGHLRETLREADKGKSIIEQLQLQHLLALMEQGNELAKKDLQHTYDRLTQAMVERRSDVLHSLVIEFGGVLPFMVAAAWSPFTDLFGKRLQDGYTDELLEQIFLASFVADGQSFICMSWIGKPNAPGQKLANQAREMPHERLGSIILQFVAMHAENIFYDPVWFEALGPAQLKRLDSLAAAGVDAMGSVPDPAGDPTLSFDLPAITRIFDAEKET